MEKVKQNNDWEIYGNSFQIEFLKKNIISDDIAHAYLFTGPSKVGKRKTALAFIKSIVCEKNKDGSFCSNCPTCKKIETNSFPDLKILDGNDIIKIDSIRDVISSLSLKAFNSPYKIVLIDNAERMNEESSNAILKTLEEPKGKTVIILITKNQRLMLPTIVSRSRILKFAPASQKEMDYVEKTIFGKNTNISQFCSGKIGKLKELSEDKDLKDFFEIAYEDIKKISKGSIYENLEIAEGLYKEYEKTPKLFLERINIWILTIRRIVLKKYTDSFEIGLKNDKISISPKEGVKIIEFLVWIKNNLSNTKSGLNYKLIIDKAILNISQAVK